MCVCVCVCVYQCVCQCVCDWTGIVCGKPWEVGYDPCRWHSDATRVPFAVQLRSLGAPLERIINERRPAATLITPEWTHSAIYRRLSPFLPPSASFCLLLPPSASSVSLCQWVAEWVVEWVVGGGTG